MIAASDRRLLKCSFALQKRCPKPELFDIFIAEKLYTMSRTKYLYKVFGPWPIVVGRPLPRICIKRRGAHQCGGTDHPSFMASTSSRLGSREWLHSPFHRQADSLRTRQILRWDSSSLKAHTRLMSDDSQPTSTKLRYSNSTQTASRRGKI